MKWLLRSHRYGPKPGLNAKSGSLSCKYSMLPPCRSLTGRWLVHTPNLGVASKECATGYSPVTWAGAGLPLLEDIRSCPHSLPGPLTIFSPPPSAQFNAKSICWALTEHMAISSLFVSLEHSRYCMVFSSLHSDCSWNVTSSIPKPNPHENQQPSLGQSLSPALGFFMHLSSREKLCTVLVYPFTLHLL